MPAVIGSVTRLLGVLAEDPEAGEAELGFIQAQPAEIWTSLQVISSLADELSAEWLKELFLNSFLQKRPELSEVKKWQGLITQTAEILRAHSSLKDHRESLSRFVAYQLSASQLNSRSKGRSVDELNQLLSQVERASSLSPEATALLIEDISSGSEDFPMELGYAAQVSDVMRAKAFQVRSLALRLNLFEWAGRFWRDLYRSRPSEVRLDNYLRSIGAVSKFFLRERTRLRGLKENVLDHRRVEIARLALDEQWGDSEFSLLARVASVGIFKEVCTPSEAYRTSSSLAECLGMENFSNQSGKILAGQYGERYGELAEAARKLFQAHPNSEIAWSDFANFFFQKKGEPVWNSCGSGEFDKRKKELLSQIEALRIETDLARKSTILVQIRRGYKNCQSF